MTSIPNGFNSELAHSSHSAHLYTILVLLVWFGMIAVLGINGFFITETGQPPLMLLVTGVVSLLLFTVGYRSITAFRSYILNLDMRLLLMLHGFRTLGLGFVMLYSIAQLPAIFALSAGFGDAITAVWAIIIAYYWWAHAHGLNKKTLLRWNHFGLADFVLALGLGVLSRSNGLLQFTGSPSSDLMMTFPFVVIPGYLVQVLVITHIIIYLQLRNNWKDQAVIKYK